MQNRFRSRTAWVAIFSLVLFVLKKYYRIELPESDTLVELVLSLMAAVGIFNNPTDKEKY